MQSLMVDQLETLRISNLKLSLKQIAILIAIKVQLFWEDHKNLRNRPHVFDIYLVNVKTMRMIAQILVAFSEKLNFTSQIVITGYLFSEYIVNYWHYCWLF